MRLLDQTGLGQWAELPFFDQPVARIEAALRAETRSWVPPFDQVFSALTLTPPDAVKVVILGQDPYPTPGHAHGLAFSVEPDVTPLPRSLANIFTELRSDLGGAPQTGDLRFWARQGVLLLNTSLTVPAGEANGHTKLGWQVLTRQVLDRLQDRPRAYLLWGKQAQRLAEAVPAPPNLKLETPHPSPLSAHRGFLGSRVFSRTNAWLQARGEVAINWTDPEAT